ncbi:PAS domain-containing protein [Bradyrhizobium sp. 13971]
MAARKLSQGQVSTREARRRWHEERSLRCAIRLARMGYWESQSAAATDLWISPELAAFYEFETADGYIPIATVRERYLPESRKLLETHYAACWAEGRPYAVRTRLRGSDGSVLDCVVHGEPEFDARGQVRRVSGIVRDVTEETSALRRLAESEQRLADFVSTASDWCWESDAEHRLLPYPKSLAGNAAFQTVAAGRKARWELTYAPEDGEAMARHRADMEAHRPFRDFTYTLIGKDGSRVSICTSGKPIFADDGSFSATAARPATSLSSGRPRRCSTSARGRWRRLTASARSAPGATGWTAAARSGRPNSTSCSACPTRSSRPMRTWDPISWTATPTASGRCRNGCCAPAGPRLPTCASCTRTACPAIWL